MRTKKSLLFVSLAFPPLVDSEGVQVAKYFRCLSSIYADEFDFDVVSASAPCLNMATDPDVEYGSEKIRQRILVNLIESRLFNALSSRAAPIMLSFPDAKASFHMQWRSVVRKLKVSPDIIYSRSFPPSSAVLALKLKRYYGVPWVMHLSDPIAAGNRESRGGLKGAILHNYEKSLLRYADAVCLTSPEQVDLYRQSYPEISHKLHYFPNVYSDSVVNSTKAPINTKGSDLSAKKLTVVYTGGLTTTRSPEFLFEALDKAPQEFVENVKFIFAGPCDRSARKVFEKFQRPWIEHVGVLSFSDSQKLQRSANVLLLIDLPFEKPEQGVYLPSKLLDYMVAARPVLAFSVKGGCVERVVNESMRGECFDFRNVDPAIAYLQKCRISAMSDGSYEEIIRPDTQYSAKHNAQRLGELLFSVLP